MEHNDPLCFIADSTLGKLTKWLRLLGFDTQYYPGRPDPRQLNAGISAGRLILTRSKTVADMLPGECVILIESNYPDEQMRQLVDEVHLTSDHLHIFSRCSICNTVLCQVVKTEIEGFVPEYVYQTHATFKRCDCCHRIYWPGSHGARWLTLKTKWFRHKE